MNQETIRAPAKPTARPPRPPSRNSHTLTPPGSCTRTRSGRHAVQTIPERAVARRDHDEDDEGHAQEDRRDGLRSRPGPRSPPWIEAAGRRIPGARASHADRPEFQPQAGDGSLQLASFSWWSSRSFSRRSSNPFLMSDSPATRSAPRSLTCFSSPAISFLKTLFPPGAPGASCDRRTHRTREAQINGQRD